jgi:hypothetical protein
MRAVLGVEYMTEVSTAGKNKMSEHSKNVSKVITILTDWTENGVFASTTL